MDEKAKGVLEYSKTPRSRISETFGALSALAGSIVAVVALDVYGLRWLFANGICLFVFGMIWFLREKEQ